MKDKIKVFILGTGYGNTVIKPSIGKKDNYEILDVVSPRKLFNERKDKNIEFNSDLQRIFYSNLADCIILAVPPRLQYYFLKHCLKGEKSFICEKPFTFSLSQAKTIHKEIIQSNVKCALGYQFRYDPLIEVFKKLNFKVLPEPKSYRSDIIQAVRLNNAYLIQKVCQSFQNSSPVDSFLNVIPSRMSGYNSKLLMSGGTFVEGSTSEFSADAPLRDPYNIFVQGGSHMAHIKIALIQLVFELLEENLINKESLISSKI